MKNEFTIKPKKYPLIIILIGTSILAVPAALGTFALFDNSTFGASNNNLSWTLILISVTGFLLFAGYILTAIFNRHYSLLWFCSFLYNLGLSGCYIFYMFWAYAQSPFMSLPKSFYHTLTSGVWLLPAWTLFVTAASFYYLKHSLFPKKIDLP
jgi:hypothetical protein